VTDEYSLTVSRAIAAPAEQLFDAWLDAESLGTWLRPSGILETRAETDPHVGGEFRIVMVREASSVVHVGTYLEIDRPHRLAFTWSSPKTAFRDTIVTVTFEPSSDNSTLVQIHQVGLPDEDARASHQGGWTDILHELARTANDERRVQS
jgi:uncharacterized protein YndB with AHSA1/START domain